MPTIHIPVPSQKDGLDINVEDVEKVESIAITSGSVIHLRNGSSVQTGLTPEQISGMIKDVTK